MKKKKKYKRKVWSYPSIKIGKLAISLLGSNIK